MSIHLQTLGTGRRGSVIVLVLGLIMLTAFLLSRFIEQSMTEMLVESRARQADRLRIDAHSALEASLAVLADYQVVDAGLHAPAQGWGTPLAGLDFAGHDERRVMATIEDESGLISLPRLSENDLTELGRLLDLRETEAALLAEALIAWTRRDRPSNRIETDPRQYEFADPPHRPPGRPIGSFGELAAIAGAREFFYTPEGQPTRLHAEFVRRVSLHYFPAANLNSAPAATLRLAGLDAEQAEKIVAYRSGRGSRAPGAPPFFRSVAEVQTVLGVAVPVGRFDTKARCLRVKVTVQEGSTLFQLIAVVAPLDSAPAQDGLAAAGSLSDGAKLHYPFKLLAFEEHIETAPSPVL